MITSALNSNMTPMSCNDLGIYNSCCALCQFLVSEQSSMKIWIPLYQHCRTCFDKWYFLPPLISQILGKPHFHIEKKNVWLNQQAHKSSLSVLGLGHGIKFHLSSPNHLVDAIEHMHNSEIFLHRNRLEHLWITWMCNDDNPLLIF